MDDMFDFTHFTELPFELRINIWKHALPGPREVPVRYSRRHKQYTSGCAPPALLHACSESRTIFLAAYEQFILAPAFESALFVNFESDTIFFDSLDCSPTGDLALDLARSPQRNKIIQCAIDVQLWEILRVFRYDSNSEVKLLRNLKSVALVLRQDFDQGLQQSQANHDGAILMEIDSDTVGSEIRHVHWYVESLRWELEHDTEGTWLNEQTPNVQMWIW